MEKQPALAQETAKKCNEPISIC